MRLGAINIAEAEAESREFTIDPRRPSQRGEKAERLAAGSRHTFVRKRFRRSRGGMRNPAPAHVRQQHSAAGPAALEEGETRGFS
jgi:hypothetical protein